MTDTRDVPGTGPVAATDRRLPELVGNPALDRLAALAARILGAPSGQVTLLTDLPTDAGAPALGVDLSQLLCALTARAARPLIVDDAIRDPRVAELVPMPMPSGGLGSYLGVPLLDADHQVAGALGVFGPEPVSGRTRTSRCSPSSLPWPSASWSWPRWRLTSTRSGPGSDWPWTRPGSAASTSTWRAGT